MQNNTPNTLKFVFIASLILNLAFIGGFVAKRFIFPGEVNAVKTVKAAAPGQGVMQCKSDCLNYQHLCKKCPEFKETFHNHKDFYHDTSHNLIKIKTEFLNELKKKELDEEAVEKLLKEINRLTSELNAKNHRHLLALRKLLQPEDFALLIKSMNRELHAHEETHAHKEKEHVSHEHHE